MYAQDLMVVAIHTPEFSFACDPDWVAQAAGRLGIRWPVLQDNQHSHWTAWAVKAWPTLFLVDRRGFIRMTHVGDRGYAQVEAALRALLQETLLEINVPPALGSVRPEDELGAVCRPITPELQADDVDHLLPPAGIVTGQGQDSDAEILTGDGYSLEGDWTRAADGWQLAGGSGAIHLTYHAAEVNAVLSPVPSIASATERAVSESTIRLELDGRPLSGGEMGSDTFRMSSGTGLRLDVPRLYNLVRCSTVQRHELRLSFAQTGPVFYAFSFGSCLMPPIQPSST